MASARDMATGTAGDIATNAIPIDLESLKAARPPGTIELGRVSARPPAAIELGRVPARPPGTIELGKVPARPRARHYGDGANLAPDTTAGPLP